MTITRDEELRGLRAAGRLVAEILRAMEAEVHPGITTADLDQIATRLLEESGARSAPRLVYDFPGSTCIRC